MQYTAQNNVNHVIKLIINFDAQMKLSLTKNKKSFSLQKIQDAD